MLRLGIDVGSTTAKLALMDESGAVVAGRYERHRGEATPLLQRMVGELAAQLGPDTPVSVSITGSVGMATAEQVKAPFVQEVVAATAEARALHPEARTLIDIGGEDAKVVFLEADGRSELRMNGNCAGGTGAFIDQMADLLGVAPAELGQMALQSQKLYPIAARCGVFAKTDVQNLQSRGAARADIARSVLHSVAVQVVTTLSHGRTIEPPVLVAGGPLTFLPALRQALAEQLNLSPDSLLSSKNSVLVPAMGCALSARGVQLTLGELERRLAQPVVRTEQASALQPLFADEAEHDAWRKAKEQNPMRRGRLSAPEERVFIGIDSGSTTTKLVATREDGEIVFTYYAPNLGNPIKAASTGLQKLRDEAQAAGCRLQVVGSCSTGYGEDFVKAAFGLDRGVVETMAHTMAARRLQPEVSFILDIGGQDMKAIWVDRGAVVRMELNESCSSGCGTFLQTFAAGLGYEVTDLARMACQARHPSDLGTRCTVFMNSKVKQALREGATVSDIAAGLSYSVVGNCLYKVLRLHDASELGRHIVVQGGTMRNDAVVRAFEVLTGRSVVRPPMPELMGAYGCALTAAAHPAKAMTIDAMLAGSGYTTRELRCNGCANRCAVTQYHFEGGGRYYSGNRCERVFSSHGRKVERARNIYDLKRSLLFDAGDCAPRAGRPTIGLPRVLGLYEDLPFWRALLTSCGFGVKISAPSEAKRYEHALCSVMSDNICFPAKLVHSHIAWLETAGVDRILFPYVIYEHRDDPTAVKSYNCPIVSGYSDVIRSAMQPRVPLDAPAITFADRPLLRKQIRAYLASLGVGRREADRAFEAALSAYDDWNSRLRAEAQSILEDDRAHGRLTIVLAGRPYHADPLIQHGLSEMIAGMGVGVISDDIVRGDSTRIETNIIRQWAYMNRIMRAAQWTAEQADDVQFVQMTSFGCGPDAFIQDEVRTLLSRREKPYTLLKLDDVSNLGSLRLRVRSLLESLTTGERSRAAEPFTTTRPYGRAGDEQLTILAPYISEFLTPLIPPVVAHAGYRAEVLPPSNDESVRLGLQYANNEVCYPATLIIGDVVRALKSGRYDPARVAVAMTQTGGQCRASSYAGLIKRAMVSAGFGQVPLITLGVGTATNEAQGGAQQRMQFNWRKLAPIVLDMLLWADVTAKFYYSALPRERKKGLADRLRDHYLQAGARVLAMAKGRAKAMTHLVRQAAADFQAAIHPDRPAPRVGIVGEIFLKFNHFAQLHLQDLLKERGIEIVPPLITPFFIQDFVNQRWKRELHLVGDTRPQWVLRLLGTWVARRMKQFDRAAAAYSHYAPFSRIEHDAERVQGLVSRAAQFGEGWLLPADIIGFYESGVKSVLSLQPFGCIANQIVDRGIERALQRRLPGLNLLSLDFDSGVSRVNVANRLLLFLDALKNDDARDEAPAAPAALRVAEG